MRIPITSNNESLMLALTLQATNGPVPLRIRVADAYKPNTSFTDRLGNLQGIQTFYVRMPRTGKLILADIFRPDPKANATDPDVGFKLLDKQVMDLPVFHGEYASADDLMQCAIKFIQEFSENAGVLGASANGSVYMSDCGRFRIDYLDVIIDYAEQIPLSIDAPDIMVANPNFGKELATPARISQDRGVIEVSKKYFIQDAVPFRVAILLHEVSHFYFNNIQEDEEEADLNALKIFLGLGYGYTDAEQAFLSVFENTPSDENVRRHQKLLDYIIDFEARNNHYRV